MEKIKQKLSRRLETEEVTVGSDEDLADKRREYYASRTGSAFLTSYDEGVRFKCMRGPIGDGKSVTMCMYIVHKSQQQNVMEITENGKTFKVRWSRWLIMRHTVKSLEETTIATWNNWFGDKTRWVCDPFEGRYEDYGPDGILTRIDFICLASKSKNIFDDLQSLELSGAWINEAVQTPYEVVARVYSRLKRFNPSPKSKVTLKTFHVIMDTNSPNETNWWYHKEQVEQPEGWLFFICPPAILEERDKDGKVRYVPNDIEHAKKHNRRPAENVKAIDGGYHESMDYWMDMLSVLSEDDVRMLLKNEYGLSVEGMGVFSDVWVPAQHKISPTDPKAQFMRGLPVIGGMDCGRTPACVLGQMMPDGKLVIQKEVTTWDKRLNNGRGGLNRMDVGKFYEEYLRPVLVNFYHYPNCGLMIAADPAGQNFSEAFSISAIERLRNEYGLNVVPCDKVRSENGGEKDITHGNNVDIRVSCMKREMRMGNILVSDACRMLCEAMAGKYCYPERRNSKDWSVEYGENPDKNDWSHIADSAQYLSLLAFKGAMDFGRPMGSMRQFGEEIEMAVAGGCNFGYA